MSKKWNTIIENAPVIADLLKYRIRLIAKSEEVTSIMFFTDSARNHRESWARIIAIQKRCILDEIQKLDKQLASLGWQDVNNADLLDRLEESATKAILQPSAKASENYTRLSILWRLSK